MDPSDETAKLRAQYETMFGKKPFPGWNADELRRRMATPVEAAPPSTHESILRDYNGSTVSDLAAQPEEDGAPAEERADVIVMVDHVYLPIHNIGDLGNPKAKLVVPDDWQNVPGNVAKLDLSENEKLELVRRLDPKKVERRRRLNMPVSCAQFLSERGQVEIL